jgi:hypothetical protein
VNYAALLAVLVVLGLFFPVLVRLANANGIPRASSILGAVFGAIAVIAWFVIRERVKRYRETQAKIETIKANVTQNPDDFSSYLLENEFLGDLLVRANRRREAIEVFERFVVIEKKRGQNTEKLERIVSRLKEDILE